MKRKRTDPHRPGASIPAQYAYVVSYSLPTFESGHAVPAINVDLILKMKKEGAKFAKTGGLGRCSVCGAHYVYGDLWRHEPTGEHVHLGHDCADKYAMLADRSAWELENDRVRAAAAREVQKALNAEARASFLAAHPGLEKALETKHVIVEDIADKFRNRYTSLTDAQIALVFRLANEAENPKPAEAHVPAPEGRVTFRGTVVSVKSAEDRWNRYGRSVVTVKVPTPEGVWLAWGTMPTIREERPRTSFVRGQILPIEKGDEIEITATLQRGREPHFAFFKRPRAKFTHEKVATYLGG